MQIAKPPTNEPDVDGNETDPLARFRNWHGFLAAAITVNVLFVFTMLGHNDTGVAIWHKVLIWFPFNTIATAVYLAIMAKLPKPREALSTTASGAGNSNIAGAFYTILCVALIIANWLVMFAA